MRIAGISRLCKKQGEELLASTYGCNESQILELIQQARIELITQWCAPQERRGI
ncbi:hypothetical protein [Nostoc sphaeroides]|uniref:hypothetical protein n=1 Tax=Nostoc sphaeroides TaxID=446679 RepID=UPI002B3FFEE9|nr:hypothetical protein [Nostoc sphaeroides]